MKSRQDNIILDGFSFFRQADAEMKTEHDSKLTRCPKLGDEMPFSYCLTETGALPCPRIIGCWQAALDVEGILKQGLTPGQWEQFSGARPKDKVSSIIELIEQARRQK